jgi:hypothetical protein
VLFFHGCSYDEEIIQLNVEFLSRIGTEMLDVGYRSIWVFLNKQDSQPVHKIELLRRMYNQKLTVIFNDQVNCKVIDYISDSKTGEGVTEVMGNTQDILGPGVPGGYSSCRA